MWIWSSLLPRSSKKDCIEIYLVFFMFYSIFYVFLKFIHISKKLNQKNKIKMGSSAWADFGPSPRNSGTAHDWIQPTRP
jgi:hypothetical protein